MMMGWTFAVIDTVSISAIKIHCNMVVDVCGKEIYVNFAAKKVCNGVWGFPTTTKSQSD